MAQKGKGILIKQWREGGRPEAKVAAYCGVWPVVNSETGSQGSQGRTVEKVRKGQHGLR